MIYMERNMLDEAERNKHVTEHGSYCTKSWARPMDFEECRPEHREETLTRRIMYGMIENGCCAVR
jgi:hypothetical protein